jgi:hypothetical protein
MRRNKTFLEMKRVERTIAKAKRRRAIFWKICLAFPILKREILESDFLKKGGPNTTGEAIKLGQKLKRVKRVTSSSF